MMEMRVMMVMNLNCRILHRVLYSSHIVKFFASDFGKLLILSTDEHR